MGEGAWNFVGYDVKADELNLIRTVVEQFAGLSRDELAYTVCELLGWTRATGRLKDAVAVLDGAASTQLQSADLT